MSEIAGRLDQARPIQSLANPQVEIGFLGDLIADNRLIDPAADKLRAVDFSVPLHGLVFGHMVEQAASGREVDVAILDPFVSGEDEWPRLRSVLIAAHMNAGTRQRTKAYLEQIADLARRRRAVLGLQEVIEAARALDQPVEEVVVRADEAVAELADGTVEIEQAPAGAYAQKVIESFGKPIVGVRCGLIGSLDNVVGVLRPTELIVVGARPGMGKSALATSYAVGAGSLGHASLIFSLEMSADEITRRMLADLCHTTTGSVPYEDIRDGNVRGDALERVIAAQRRLDQLPIEISDRAGLTVAMLARRVRRHKRRLAAKGQKLALVIVDYLQLIAPSRANQSTIDRISEISMALKALAKNEGLTVMALSQLSREVERRPDKRPVPSDLRDSGQIEQDADVLLFLYREEYYLGLQEPADQFGPKYETWRTDMEAVRNRIEFLVRKRRSGPAGQAMGWFFGANAAMRGDDFYRLGDGGPYG